MLNNNRKSGYRFWKQ